MAIPAWASVSPGFVLERMAIPAWASVSPEEQQHHRRLTLLLRSKQRVLKAPLAAMDEQERQLQSRLEGLQRMPPPQHRLLQKIVRTAIVAEVARASPAEKPEGVRQRSHDYVKMDRSLLIKSNTTMAYTYTPQGHPTQQHQGQQQGFTSEGHPVAPPAAYPQPPPGSYYGPGVATLAPPNSGLWTTGLCGCTEDCPSCWCAWCCPCVLVGRMANILDQGMTSVFTGAAIFCIVQWFTGCGCLYSCLYRAKLRHKYGLPEEPCNDICTECWCNCCSIAQAYRELRNRNINPALGYEFARAVYEQPPQVQEMRKI